MAKEATKLTYVEIGWMEYCMGRTKNQELPRDKIIEYAKAQTTPFWGRVLHWAISGMRINKATTDCFGHFIIDSKECGRCPDTEECSKAGTWRKKYGEEELFDVVVKDEPLKGGKKTRHYQQTTTKEVVMNQALVQQLDKLPSGYFTKTKPRMRVISITKTPFSAAGPPGLQPWLKANKMKFKENSGGRVAFHIDEKQLQRFIKDNLVGKAKNIVKAKKVSKPRSKPKTKKKNGGNGKKK